MPRCFKLRVIHGYYFWHDKNGYIYMYLVVFNFETLVQRYGSFSLLLSCFK